MPLEQNPAPRHSTFDKDPESSSRQASESARDTGRALDRKLSAHVVTVPRYNASGNTSARIRLEASDRRPLAVLLAKAATVANPSAPLNVGGTYNFVWDPTSRGLDVFEPSGLVQFTAYALSFLVVEG